MIKMRHTGLIIISGLVWFCVGLMLLTIGLGLLAKSSNLDRFSEGAANPLLTMIAPYFGTADQASLFLIAIALLIGYFKGRYVLGKSANQGVQRIKSFPNPTSLANIYSKKYYILLAVMVGLGLSIKYLGLPNDVRGAIDVAIGSALINGAMIYFRHAATLATART